MSSKNLPSFTDIDLPNSDFFYNQAQFQDLTEHALAHAKRLGASDAVAEVTEGCGLSVSVRHGDLEHLERSRGKSLDITVYLEQRSGHASTSDFSLSAIEQTAKAAYDIAHFTAQDPFMRLPESSDMASAFDCQKELDLFHPWALSVEEAMNIAQTMEEAAFATSPLITNSEGAGVSSNQSHFYLANSQGFGSGYAQSRHSISSSFIAGKTAHMQRDGWYSSKRHPQDLADPKRIGNYAAQRALSHLNAKKIATCECPVLFESPLAVGLLGAFCQAVSGGALYRKSSFLLDSLGKIVFPKSISIDEDPFIPRGMGSSPFDREGVKVKARQVVKNGRVESYFLSSYSARKLGLKTTGNAGGSHNLTLSSKDTKASDDLSAMLERLNTGLLATDLMGQGVNYVTGDYSRGASGFWVENGVISYPVEEITIAGNLREMFLGIVAVGADAYTYGAKTCGSILINRMKIAGS